MCGFVKPMLFIKSFCPGNGFITMGKFIQNIFFKSDLFFFSYCYRLFKLINLVKGQIKGFLDLGKSGPNVHGLPLLIFTY